MTNQWEVFESHVHLCKIQISWGYELFWISCVVFYYNSAVEMLYPKLTPYTHPLLKQGWEIETLKTWPTFPGLDARYFPKSSEF